MTLNTSSAAVAPVELETVRKAARRLNGMTVRPGRSTRVRAAYLRVNQPRKPRDFSHLARAYD